MSELTSAHLEAFTYWVSINASAPVENYRAADAVGDFLTVWPDLADVHQDLFVAAIIAAMAATLEGGTTFDGIQKLKGVLSAYYYAPRPDRGAWSPARDAADGVPVGRSGEAFYRA